MYNRIRVEFVKRQNGHVSANSFTSGTKRVGFFNNARDVNQSIGSRPFTRFIRFFSSRFDEIKIHNRVVRYDALPLSTHLLVALSLFTFILLGSFFPRHSAVEDRTNITRTLYDRPYDGSTKP